MFQRVKGALRWLSGRLASAVHSQIKVGALISYAAVLFNTVAGLVYTPWMISCIGTEDYGLYTLAISVVNFFLLDFGLGSAVSRFLSKYYAEGREAEVGAFLGVVYKSYLAITLAIAVALVAVFFNIEAIYGGLEADEIGPFKGLFLIVAAYSVFSFPFAPLDGILISNERFVALNLCNLLQKMSAVLFIVVSLLIGWGVYALVLANALTSVFFTLTKLVIVRTRTEARADMRHWESRLAREVFGFSLWVTVVTLCQRLIFSIMPSILAITANSTEVALFGLASSLEGYVYTVAAALNNMFMPKVSRSLAGKDIELQEMMSRYGRIQLYIIGFIFICFAVFGGWFIECWMGVGYETLWPCALLLILPGVVELPQLIGKTAITASNNVRAQALVYLGMAVLNVVLGSVLSLFMGALGACISICIAYFVRTFGCNVIYKTRLGVRLRRFFRDTYASWIPVALATAVVSAALLMLCPLSGWLGLVVCVVASFAVYAVLAWRFSMNAYEKALIGDMFKGVQARFSKK